MKFFQHKIRISCICAAIIIATLALSVAFSGNRNSDNTPENSVSESETEQSQDSQFESYIDDLFRQEISASALSLHYTLKNPENYGITDFYTELGVYSAESALISAALSENISATLAEFDRDALSLENRLTLDLLEDSISNTISAAAFPYYDEPLRPSTGDAAELPILFAEYTFDDTQDVADYLEILASVPAYFESICVYEREKYAQGLFMSDFAAEAVISQCEDFAASAENNYLIYTFDEKIDALDGLSKNEKTAYKKQNQAILTGEVLPAYETIAQTLSALAAGTDVPSASANPISSPASPFVIRSSSNSILSPASLCLSLATSAQNHSSALDKVFSENATSTSADKIFESTTQNAEASSDENGLCNLPLGKAYYEYLVRSYTGSSDSVETLQSRTEAQRAEDLSKAASLLTEYPELSEQWSNPASEILSATPKEMLAHLEDAIKADFPSVEDCNYTVKYVDEAMQDYLSPAFYLTSPIDDFTENSIYINSGSGYEGLKLFTTLAHEGYPGHLYQNAAFSQTNPSPLRALLGPAGYTEGWATYVEMLSYQYAGLSDELATLLSLEQSAILSLYASADIGIHYDGWDFAQTLEFFSDYGYSDEETIREIYELIVEEPANYLKYYVGYLEFLALKDYAKESLGEQYSEQNFHQTILEIGPATFPILKEYFLEYYPG